MVLFLIHSIVGACSDLEKLFAAIGYFKQTMASFEYNAIVDPFFFSCK
jgi:hypothetical protein